MELNVSKPQQAHGAAWIGPTCLGDGGVRIRPNGWICTPSPLQDSLPTAPSLHPISAPFCPSPAFYQPS